MDNAEKARESVENLLAIATELNKVLEVYNASIPCGDGNCPFPEAEKLGNCSKRCSFGDIHEEFLRAMHSIRERIFENSGDW